MNEKKKLDNHPVCYCFFVHDCNPCFLCLKLLLYSFQTKCKQGIVDPMLSIWGQQLIVHEDTNQ